MKKLLIGLGLLSLSTAAFAQGKPQAITITSNIQAVKEITDANGARKKTLVDPTTVIPGTPLVVWINYKNATPAPVTGFVINNPVPAAIDFTALGENSEWGVVSVDGGKTFGALATLKVMGADKKPRAAIPQDVTHVRWTFSKPIAGNSTGRLSFYAMVK